jgi:hypothetical protein
MKRKKKVKTDNHKDEQKYRQTLSQQTHFEGERKIARERKEN